MKQTVSKSMFMDAFRTTNRKENFSYDGLSALYDYLEDYEESAGQEIELDVIGLCCDFSEYEDLEEFQTDYSKDYRTIEDIEEATTVIPIDADRFIIQVF